LPVKEIRQRTNAVSAENKGINKARTGIAGLDEVTFGGLPAGRPTLVCGTAGCGKTLLGMEFLVRGATEFNEPGVFVAFEESAKELAENVRSLGFDLDKLQRQQKLFVDYVHIERSEIAETGAYDLDGLFIRLADAIETVGAKRIVLDTLETLFSALPNEAILRAELRRLFRWLKDRGLTAVITAERGDGALTRNGLEEYVSDCVILLDHRITDQVATRRLRIVKYRGTLHGTNEYPFLIEEKGLEVLPITSISLDHGVSSQRISSGIGSLDTMLAGGMYRGSALLISGTAGTGKSSLSAQFARAACDRGERVLYFAFEESPAQITRNMRSIGIDLRPHIEKGKFRCIAARPTLYGLESHLAVIHKHIREFKPSLVVIDPITNFAAVGSLGEVKSMLMRLVDFLKAKQITAVFTSLTTGGQSQEATTVAVSSVIDTWIVLRDIELNGERNRGMYVIKSRGVAHSNQIREYLLTSKGIQLIAPYLGPEGVLTGSARLAQEAKEKAAALEQKLDIARKERLIAQKRLELEAQTESLRARFENEIAELSRDLAEAGSRAEQIITNREAMAGSRKAAAATPAPPRLRVRRATENA
jgi:circadian clock protein KaiC